MSKRYKIVCLALLFLGVGVLVGWYLRHTSIPVLEPRGPIAQKERRLIIVTLLLSLIVVIPVFGLLFGFAWKYREGNKKAKYSPNLDHSRVVETIWWLVPSALILVIGIITWNSSHQLDPYKPLSSNTPPITIQVVALDWKWLFIYPQQNMATVNLVQFPMNTPVNFEITADAPMNSFWIPQLGGQIYAMPGMSTQLHLMANTAGNFYGSSANISGKGFAGMSFVAKSTSANDFKRWVRSVKHSPNRLSQGTYSKLSNPSQANPVAYYASSEAGLYDNVIMKYTGPFSNMQGMEMQ